MAAVDEVLSEVQAELQREIEFAEKAYPSHHVMICICGAHISKCMCNRTIKPLLVMYPCPHNYWSPGTASTTDTSAGENEGDEDEGGEGGVVITAN